MQKSGFPKMRHYVGFWQIGSHICTHMDTCTDRHIYTHMHNTCTMYLKSMTALIFYILCNIINSPTETQPYCTDTP